jgi:hypothetical protein
MTSNNNEVIEHQLIVFSTKNILLEETLNELQKQGIDVGRNQIQQKQIIVDTELFEHDILTKAKRMADFYILYFTLENSVRRLIYEVLSEKYGEDWWEKSVPDGVKESVRKVKEAERNTSMSIRSEDPLAYTDFGELIDIFNKNWPEFSKILRSQRSVQDVLSQFNKIRNMIAHSCELNDDEISRFRLAINDWLRIQN